MPPGVVELGPARWLLLVACGAFLGVDATSWPQLMVSRPIVSGTLGGLVFGSAEAGLLAGAALEVVSLRHPPYGAARYPDTGPAGLIAGAAYAGAGGEGFYPLLGAVLIGWVLGWAGSHSVHLLRTLNGHLVGDPAELAVSPGRVVRRHRLAVRLDAARAGLLTGAFLIPALVATRVAAGIPPGPAGGRWAVWLAALGLAAAAGAGGRSLGAGIRGWPLLLGGAAVAFLVGR